MVRNLKTLYKQTNKIEMGNRGVDRNGHKKMETKKGAEIFRDRNRERYGQKKTLQRWSLQ